MGAAIIALKLYTDWRDPIKLQNKFEFHKFSKELFNDFWVKASEYINSDLDTRLKITSINLEKNQRAAIEFNRSFYTLKSILNEFDLYFNRALLHKDLKCKAPLIEPNLRRNLGK
ncbi:hypothetical protein K5F07_19695, partial [Acinetobacter baumannii]|nr:hypothetical protein [Acinetobacter baumannii]